MYHDAPRLQGIAMRSRIGLMAGVSLLILASFSVPARAEGALAVGVTSEIVKDGVAVGAVVNAATRDRAEQVALEQCRGFQGAPRAVPNCKLVASFRRQCYAVAFDPSTDEPGYGFAVAKTKELAEEAAINECRKRSRDERKSFCKLDLNNCDVRD
jgi:hypothetical protein